jgi:hypothetical protein
MKKPPTTSTTNTSTTTTTATATTTTRLKEAANITRRPVVAHKWWQWRWWDSTWLWMGLFFVLFVLQTILNNRRTHTLGTLERELLQSSSLTSSSSFSPSSASSLSSSLASFLAHYMYPFTGVGQEEEEDNDDNNNMTALVTHYLQHAHRRREIDPSLPHLHYGSALQHLRELIQDMPLDTFTEEEQAFIWDKIAPPLVKFFLVEAEYVDHALQTDSPVGYEPPIFVVGFPKSGLSFLHRLLTLDTRARTPLIWEAGFDIADYRETPSLVQRQALAEELMARMHVPGSIHAHSPCDDSVIREYALTANAIAFDISAPKMILWARSSDVALKQMQFHKRWAQLFQRLTALAEPTRPPPRHWVFKSIDYDNKIDSLLQVYPDAKIIWVHNRIRQTFPQQLQESITVYGTGVLLPSRKYLRLLGEEIVQSFALLDTLPRNRLMHLHFDDLAQDPVQTIRAIYEQFELGPVTAQHERDMIDYLDTHPYQKKHVQLTWPETLRIFGMKNEQDLLQYYGDYVRRFPRALE